MPEANFAKSVRRRAKARTPAPEGSRGGRPATGGSNWCRRLGPGEGASPASKSRAPARPLTPAPIPPLVAAKLCEDVYADHGDSPLRPGGAGSGDPALAGWVRKESYPGDDGFYAAYYENPETGQKILVFRGTEPKSGSDWWTNVKQALGFESKQHKQAISLARQLELDHGSDMELAGHSLGGGLAATASAATGRHATTFNAAGVSDRTLDREALAADMADVDNYSVRGEILTTAQEVLPIPRALGRQHTLDAAGGITAGDVAAATAAGAIVGGGAGAAAVGGGTAAAASVQRHLMSSVIRSVEASPGGGL